MNLTKAIAIIFLCSAARWIAAVPLSVAAQGQSARTAPVPREAVPAVIDLFEQYSIVALSEGPHNNQKGHEFRLALVRDSRFGRLVNDVVVEFGNARYQRVMDRFTAGEDVPYRELRQVWENTTVGNGTLWDSPIYYEFFASIRDVNRATGSHIRVVLGDPPIDWASIRGVDEINSYYPQRSPHAATIIQEEVLKKNHRALVIYGEGHLFSTGRLGADTLVTNLKRDSSVRIFTISNGYPDLSAFQRAAAPLPSLILLKGTTAGTALSAAGTPLERDFDAVLDLGGPSALSMTRVHKSVCNDTEYLKMRFERYALSTTPANPDPGEELRRLCELSGAR